MASQQRVRQWFSQGRFQIIYGICLIVLITATITLNTILIILRYSRNMDIALQRRALLMGRVFQTAVQEDVSNVEKLQERVDAILQTSSEILDIRIFLPRNDGFQIVVSGGEKEKGKVVNSLYYHLAWQQKEGEALATDSSRLLLNAESSDFDSLAEHGRFWLVSMPMRDESGEKKALMIMVLSSEVINDLMVHAWNVSLFSLLLTVLITVLFLAVSTRLWRYAGMYQKVKEVDKMKDEFISIASHELRSPITTIRGYIQMILDGDYGEVSQKLRKGLQRVLLSSKRLSELVEDLLNVSRIEQGRMNPEPEVLHPCDVVSEVVNQLQVKAQEKGLRLLYMPAGASGDHPSSQEESADSAIRKRRREIQILIDPDHFQQILFNIIGNAVKYTKTGKVEVHDMLQDGKYVIEIQDTGVGISAEDQKRLFQKFFRVQSDETRGIAGTGLGLWITRQLVVMNHGEIYFESMKGVGTRVTLRFPLASQKTKKRTQRKP